MLLSTNATIATQRSTYNAATKQSTLAAHLTNVPVYIREIGNDLRAKGMAVEYDARMTFDASWDIVDGDQLTGYDPTGVGPGGADGRNIAPIWTVRHVAVKAGAFGSFKVALLRALRQ